MASLLDEDLGFMFVSEQTSPEDNKPMNLDQKNENGLFYYEFDSVLQSFDVINRNNRMYYGPNVWSCITESPKIQDALKNDRWFGEADHPLQEFVNKPLTPERLQNVPPTLSSHKIRNPRIEGNLLVGHIVTDAGTENGRNFAIKIAQGMTPSFSARSIAKMGRVNGKAYVLMRKLICYDWVLYQSHREASMIGKPEYHNLFESVDDTVKEESATREIVSIPILELLQHVSKASDNVNIVNESFGLDEEFVPVGFTKDNCKVVLESGSRIAYVNLEPELRSKVNSYIRHIL